MKNDCSAVTGDKLMIIGKMLPKIQKNTDKRNTKRIKGLKGRYCYHKTIVNNAWLPIYN